MRRVYGRPGRERCIYCAAVPQRRPSPSPPAGLGPLVQPTTSLQSSAYTTPRRSSLWVLILLSLSLSFKSDFGFFGHPSPASVEFLKIRRGWDWADQTGEWWSMTQDKKCLKEPAFQTRTPIPTQTGSKNEARLLTGADRLLADSVPVTTCFLLRACFPFLMFCFTCKVNSCYRYWMNVGELLASVKVLVGHPRCMFCLSLNLLSQQLQSILIDLLHIHRIFPANCNSLKYQVPCGQLTWFGPSQFFDPISATRSMLFWVEVNNIWGHFPFLNCKHDYMWPIAIAAYSFGSCTFVDIRIFFNNFCFANTKG